MADFPTKGALSQGESPSKYDITEDSNELKAPTDAGYEFKRPRYTRAAPSIVTTGFIGLPHEDYLTLRAFWDTHKTVLAFTYYDYMHDVTRQVRFDEVPKWGPQAIGTTRLWSPTFKLKEI